MNYFTELDKKGKYHESIKGAPAHESNQSSEMWSNDVGGSATKNHPSGSIAATINTNSTRVESMKGITKKA